MSSCRERERRTLRISRLLPFAALKTWRELSRVPRRSIDRGRRTDGLTSEERDATPPSSLRQERDILWCYVVSVFRQTNVPNQDHEQSYQGPATMLARPIAVCPIHRRRGSDGARRMRTPEQPMERRVSTQEASRLGRKRIESVKATGIAGVSRLKPPARTERVRPACELVGNFYADAPQAKKRACGLRLAMALTQRRPAGCITKHSKKN